MHRAMTIMHRCCTSLPLSLLLIVFITMLSVLNARTSAHAYALTATGISTCYNDTTQIACPTSGQDFFGQDGSYRIGKAFSYSAGGDIVTDKITGLIWQAADSAGTINWDNAVAYCENLDLSGQTDWRLPTRKELLSLTDDARQEPAIDPAVPCVSARYWTISKDGDPYTESRYIVNFTDAQWGKATYSELLNVRCVRGGAIPESVYAINGDNVTVTDTTTGLVWERSGSDTNMSWKDALAWCEARDTGGKTDWRLPNKKELETLVYDTGIPPLAISPEFLEPSTGRRYWSGSPYTGPPAESWRIDFDYAKGTYYGNLRPYMYYVRCVRGGGSSPPTTPMDILLIIDAE